MVYEHGVLWRAPSVSPLIAAFLKGLPGSRSRLRRD
jgi:hypothetical protein